MTTLPLPGLSGESPAAALALYGIAQLLAERAAVQWQAHGDGWCGALVSDEIGTVDELAQALSDAVAADPLDALQALAKDVNELRPDAWRRGVTGEDGASVRNVIAGLCAETPLRAAGQVPMTPLCVYSFGTRGTLFGNAVKQDAALKPADLRALLVGSWNARKDVNTLGLDPGARRQDGAVIGPDPSADGVRGVPALVPLALRGLAAVAPMPGISRVGGGAFLREAGRVSFSWPIFTTPVTSELLGLVAGRDWRSRDAAARAAAGIEAVYAAAILRDERRLGYGRRVA